MTSTTLKDQLRRLIELQNIDVDIFRFKNELHDRPLEIEKLKGEFEAKKVTLKSLEDKLKHIQVVQKDLDNDIKSKDEAIAKLDGSLSLLKTNKEYQTRLLEIENVKADKSLVEDKILAGFDELESARKAVEAERVTVAQYEKDFLAKKKEVEDAIAVINDQMKVKESQRQRITPEVRPDILSKYERILQNKDGLGIVPVNGHTCGGCYMHLTDHLLNQIKKYEELVSCDMCARIVYIPDEL